MRLTQLRDLIAIVDSGSIRAAARSLAITPPVLTRSIRELEAEFGAQLLERTAHGVVPTKTGELFLTRARTVQSEVSRMREETARRAGGAGALTFGLGSTGQAILSGAVRAFRRDHPFVGIRIFGGMPATMLPLLREGRLDFAIGHINPSFVDKHIKLVPLFRNEAVIVGRRGHPLCKAKSLQELDNADWVSMGPAFDDTPDGPTQMVREVSTKSTSGVPRSVVQCTDTGAILNLLGEADFLIVMSRSRLAQSPWREVVQAFDIKLAYPSSLVHLYYRADAQFGPEARAMIAAVKAEARKIAFSGKGRDAPAVAQSRRAKSE